MKYAEFCPQCAKHGHQSPLEKTETGQFVCKTCGFSTQSSTNFQRLQRGIDDLPLFPRGPKRMGKLHKIKLEI